jgi:iron complex transport system substrate-binding protein
MKRKHSPRRVWITAALLLLATAAFCGGQQEAVESGETITVTDLRGKEVSITTPVQRVVATFNFEEVLAVIGGNDPFDKIVGWSRGYWEGRRQSKWEKHLAAYPQIEDISNVGYVAKGTFSVEKVISLRPDVVISWLGDPRNDPENFERLEAAGIPVVCVDYHAQTIENHSRSTLMLGRIFGQEERAEQIVDYYKEQVEPVLTRIEGIADRKPRVYVEFGGDKPYQNTYGAGFMWGGIAEACGGDNISAEPLGNTNGPIDPEYFFKKDPEVIIIAGRVVGGEGIPGQLKLGYDVDRAESKTLLEQIAARKGWDAVSAAKNRRIYGIYHANSRHIYDFYSFQLFAKWFYPEHFRDLDPEKNLRDFYERFMPVSVGEGDTFSVSLKD